MKKLLLLFVALFVIISLSLGQKALIDHPEGYIEVQDSNATDATEAPQFFFKMNVNKIVTEPTSASGVVQVWLVGNQPEVGYADFEFNASDFSQFATNTALRDWLVDKVYQPLYSGFDVSTGLFNFLVGNAAYSHYTTPEHTDLTNFTGDSAYHPVMMDSYANLGLEVHLSGGASVVIFETLDASLSNSDETGWLNISDTIFGGDSLVSDIDTILWINDRSPVKYLLKYKEWDGTNAIDILTKKYY